MKKIKEQLRLLKLLLTDIELNRTHAEHAFVAVLHQLAVVAVFGWFDLNASLWAGAALGAGVFVGREHAQAEQRVLRAIGYKTLTAAGEDGYKVSLMAHDLKYWNQDSLLDWLVPLFVVVLVAGLATVLI